MKRRIGTSLLTFALMSGQSWISAGAKSTVNVDARALVSQAVPLPPPTAESVKAEWSRWKTAAMHGDSEYLSGLLTSDYTEVSWRGKVYDRTAVIERTRNQPKNSAPVPRSPDEVVQLHGNVASVHLIVSIMQDGKLLRIHFTDDFVFEARRWKAFYSQQTVVTDSQVASELQTSELRTQTASMSKCDPQPSKGGDQSETLKLLRHEWLVAEIRGNSSFLLCLLAPDYREVSYRGSVRDREALIQSSIRRADPNQLIPPAVSDQIAMIHGEAAVVRNLWSGMVKGQPMKLWLADTFVKEQGFWRAINSQQTVVPMEEVK